MFFGIGAVGCDDEQAREPPCVSNLSTNCRPLYDPPTFQAVYENTLHPTCGSGTGTCHTADAAKGGLVFEDPDAAYELLLGKLDGRARVIPDDPACSLLVKRLESSDPAFRMPPGTSPLPAAERCTVIRWIAQGAKR